MLLFPFYTDEETGGQRGEVTWTKSHSESVTKKVLLLAMSPRPGQYSLLVCVAESPAVKSGSLLICPVERLDSFPSDFPSPVSLEHTGHGCGLAGVAECRERVWGDFLLVTAELFLFSPFPL